MIESHLNVRIVTRDGWLQVDGEEAAIEKVEAAGGSVNLSDDDEDWEEWEEE